MYSIDMKQVRDIVSKITSSRTVENVAFVGCEIGRAHV